MSERVNIKADEATRDRLQELKRDGETWDGLLRRAADVLEADESRDKYPGAPRCTNCSVVATIWTMEGGQVLCDDCSEGDIELPDDYPGPFNGDLE